MVTVTVKLIKIAICHTLLWGSYIQSWSEFWHYWWSRQWQRFQERRQLYPWWLQGERNRPGYVRLHLHGDVAGQHREKKSFLSMVKFFIMFSLIIILIGQVLHYVWIFWLVRFFIAFNMILIVFFIIHSVVILALSYQYDHQLLLIIIIIILKSDYHQLSVTHLLLILPLGG